jgi:uncharacterized membrane protein YphA (DoxX/SURF4 family)
MVSVTKKRNILTEITAIFFIILFVYAATSKLLDFQKFRVQLAQSPLLTAFADWVAWIIPMIEITISLMLAFPKTRLTALYASFGLMTMFTCYIIAITRFSEYIPCSCGGVLQNMSWNAHLIFNIVFTLLPFVAIILRSSHSSNERLAFAKNPTTTLLK